MKPKEKENSIQESPLKPSGLVVEGESIRKQEARNILAQWQPEVEALQKEKFHSIEHAIEALVEVVLKKSMTSEDQYIKSKQFLVDLMGTDPSIVSVLKTTLKIN